MHVVLIIIMKPRLIRFRREYIVVCTLLFVLGAALFLQPFSSIHKQLLVIGGHGILIHDLLVVKEPHVQNRLFSEHSSPPIVAKTSNCNGCEPAANKAMELATNRAIARRARSAMKHHQQESVGINSSPAKEIEAQAGCTKRQALLKVFMYDLPSEFHFGMIDPTSVKEGHTWPVDLEDVVRYPGGLYQQHSPEYWLTLDLLRNSEFDDEECIDGHIGKSLNDPARAMKHYAPEESKPKQESNNITRRWPCVAMRVRNASDADVYFVPFFGSLSYNKYGRMRMKDRDEELQRKVMEYVVKKEAWKRFKGRDHVIVMHHPNSLQMVRDLLGEATFIVADFGRVSSKVSHLGKDIVAPYKHIMPTFHEDQTSFASRPTLLFFQGAIHRKEGGFIRQKLYNLIKNEKDVVFKDGGFNSASLKSATKGMRSSKFCLHLAGDTPSSNRLFDAIVSHCVPVIVSKDIELPYEDTLDYSNFCLFVNYEDILKRGFLIDFLKSIGREEWTRMWQRLKEVQIHFEYQFPSQENDATNMVWKSLAHRVPLIKEKLHKLERYSRSSDFKV